MAIRSLFNSDVITVCSLHNSLPTWISIILTMPTPMLGGQNKILHKLTVNGNNLKFHRSKVLKLTDRAVILTIPVRM